MTLFHEQLGFTKAHPFAQTNADEEPFLKSYFVPPPFFASVLGDPRHPSATVVLAPRGAGKSAQRRSLELWCEENDVLAVTYDRFEFGAGQKIQDISLAYHLRNIIIRFLVVYLSHLQEKRDAVDSLSKKDRRDLTLFVQSYLGGLTGGQLQELLRELKSLPERFKDFWRENVGVLESVVNIVLKRYGLDAIDLPDLAQEQKKLSDTYKHQLEFLRLLAKKIGLTAVYILVDKVDETEKTGNNSELSYRLIQPMLQDLELLGLEGIGFKFFLWDAVLPRFLEDARPDRVAQHHISWTITALKAALSKRLFAFSEGKIDKFADLLDEKLDYDVDFALALLANGSPRNLIRLCEKILAAESETNPAAHVISQAGLDSGVRVFCDQVVTEQYGMDVVKDLSRVGRELFTINYLSNDVFKTTHENTSRNKVTGWQKSGLVKQIGEVSVKESRRPLNFYYVADPAMIRTIYASKSISDFLRDHWLPCDSCKFDNLMDVGLFPEGNDAVCSNCGRNLL